MVGKPESVSHTRNGKSASVRPSAVCLAPRSISVYGSWNACQTTDDPTTQRAAREDSFRLDGGAKRANGEPTKLMAYARRKGPGWRARHYRSRRGSTDFGFAFSGAGRLHDRVGQRVRAANGRCGSLRGAVVVGGMVQPDALPCRGPGVGPGTGGAGLGVRKASEVRTGMFGEVGIRDAAGRSDGRPAHPDPRTPPCQPHSARWLG